MHLRLRGFTLIELLIVIGIIGLLIALGVGNFATARIKARDAKRKSDLETIAKSLEAYANDYNSYPISSSGLILCQPATTCDWGTEFTDGKSVYTAKLPQDSATPNRDYYYDSTDGSSYTIYTFLENENDPAIDSSIVQSCGIETCNYKITSSNIQ